MQSEQERVRRKTNFWEVGPFAMFGCALVHSGCPKENACHSRRDAGAPTNYGRVTTSFGAFGSLKFTPRSRLACMVDGRSRSAITIFFDQEPVVQ